MTLLPSDVTHLHLLKSHPTWIRTCHATCTSLTRSLSIRYSDCHLICLCFQPTCQDHHSSKAMSNYYVKYQWCEFILEDKLKCLQQMLRFHRYRIVSWDVMAPGHLILILSCCVPPPLLDMCFVLALVPAIYDSRWKHIWLAHLYSSSPRKLPNLAVLLAPRLLDRSQWARPDGRRKWTPPSNCPMPEKCWLWDSAVLCIAYNQRAALSCALPIIRGLSSSLGQGSQVLVFLAELSQCPTVELPARWAVTAAESEKLCKRKKRFFQFSRRKSLREWAQRKWESKTKAKGPELKCEWQEGGSWWIQTTERTWAASERQGWLWCGTHEDSQCLPTSRHFPQSFLQSQTVHWFLYKAFIQPLC